jgi:DNA-binding NtrC family response regulator
MIAERRFREDLYYRLNVVHIALPPLRERPEDIPRLADYMVRRLAHKYQWPHLVLTEAAQHFLQQQPWPGNIRQLQNVLARAAILARGRPIRVEDLSLPPPRPAPVAATALAPATMSLKAILAETERRVILQALEQENWHRTRAARLLGISRRQLFDKIQQYGLEPPS